VITVIYSEEFVSTDSRDSHVIAQITVFCLHYTLECSHGWTRAAHSTIHLLSLSLSVRCVHSLCIWMVWEK